MEGRLVRARPRGTWISRNTAGSRRRIGSAGRSTSWTSPPRRPSCYAAGSRRSARRPRRISAGGPAGRPRRPRRARRRASREVDLGGNRLRARRRPRADTRAGALRGAPPDARPDDDGLEGAGLVPRRARPTLFDTNGNAGPTVWWDGRVVGGWSQRRDGEIVVGLLEDVGSDARAAIEVEVARLEAWIGDARFSPGFLPPFQRSLAG